MDTSQSILDYYWLIPGKLAGGSHPGRNGSLAINLPILRGAGFNTIITLTEEPINPKLLSLHNFSSLHVPIDNLGVPTEAQAFQAIDYISAAIQDESQTLVHCYAGYGRTGLILGATLIANGLAPTQAIHRIRQIRPGAIESTEQEQFLLRFTRTCSERSQSTTT